MNLNMPEGKETPLFQKCPNCLNNEAYHDTPKVYNQQQIKAVEEEGVGEDGPDWNRVFRCERCKSSLYLEQNGRIRTATLEERKKTCRRDRQTGQIVAAALLESGEKNLESRAEEVKKEIIAGREGEATVASVNPLADCTVAENYAHDPVLKEFLNNLIAGIHRAVAEKAVIAGRFRLEKYIGQGGKSLVALAVDQQTNDTVVLKFNLETAFKGDESSLSKKRVKRAYQIQLLLNSLNVVRPLALIEDENFGYIVVESFIPGITLKEVLQGKKQSAGGREEILVIPEIRAIEVALQIGRVLQQAWNSFEIIHRDIKPGNIMLAQMPSGQIISLLIDFGEARSNKTDRRDNLGGVSKGLTEDLQIGLAFQSLTLSGMIIGTPHYMAPEQVEGGRLGHWTDQYGLAATIFHVVTGQPLFGGDTLKEIIAKVLHGVPQPAHRVAKQNNRIVSEEFSKVLLKALSKEAKNRYPSPEAFLKALELCLFPKPKRKSWLLRLYRWLFNRGGN